MNDIFKLSTIQSFNYRDHNNYYAGECAQLYGSTGELFPPKQSRDSIELFMPDLCRTVPFDYERDVTVHGVSGFRFSGGRRSIDNGTEFPENLCYADGSEEIVPSGVMNVSACRFGSPVFISYPHFYAGDQFYADQVEGLEPADKDKHQSYFTLEPVSRAIHCH